MVDFTELEKEKIAEADKHEHRKANTLGADCSVHEEPFGNSEIILREDIFSETPTAESNFAAPDYGDAPPNGNSGAVATRHIEVALYPVPTSGIKGTSTTQTFLAVRSLPESDDPIDVEAVRIKQLVPPDLSLGRTNAADPDPNFRGFELALYPAYPDGYGNLFAASSTNESVLGLQDGYLDGYQIPLTADPSAEYGIGNDARISVDYANGVIRLSSPPLRSLNKSIINPFDVFSERDGYTETTPELGFPTLFATFYEYTGPKLIDTDDVGFVVVGDGTDSYGNFYGPTSTVMQKAVDSLSPLGGTVFVKEGNYSYTNTVFIPENVNVVALSRRAKITRPNAQAAFKIFGSNSSIQGFTIDGITPTSGGAIEVGTQNGSNLENIKILDNFIYSNANTRSIAFTGDSGAVTYSNIEIGRNKFRSDGVTANYIGDVSSGATVTIDQIRVYENDFGSTVGNALTFTGTAVNSLTGVILRDNYAEGNVNINLQHGSTVERFVFENNDNFEDVTVYGISEGFFANNKFQNFEVTNGLAQVYFNQNELNDIILDGAVTNTRFSKNELNKLNVDHSANILFLTENYLAGDLILRGESGVATTNLNDITITNNHILGNLDISNDLTTIGTHTVSSLRLFDNIISGSVRVGRNPAPGAITAITYNDLKVDRNEIGESSDLGEPFGSFVIGEFGSDTDVNINNLEFNNNTLLADGYMLDNTVFDEGSKSEFKSNKFSSSNGSLVFRTTTLNNVTIENNSLQNIKLFADAYQGGLSLSGSVTSKNISIKNNKILSNGVISADPLGTNGNLFTLENYVVSDNLFISDGDIRVLNTSLDENYAILNSSFDNNYMATGGSSIVIGAIANLTGPNATIENVNLNDNRVNGNLTLGGHAATNVSISNNNVSEKISTINTLSESVVSDNISSGFDINNDYTDVVISGNSLGSEGFDIDGSFVDVIMSNNKITGPTNISNNITTSTINGNTLTSWNNNNFDQSSFVGNKLTSLTSQDITSSSFGNNFVAGNVTINQLEDSNLESFSLEGDLAITSLIESSVLDSNITGDVTITTSTTSDFSGNNVTGTFRVSGVSTDSKYLGNTIITTGTSASIGFGTLLRTKVQDNIFSSTSSTENIFVEDMTNSEWIANDAYHASGQDIAFNVLEGSNISSSLFLPNVTLGRVSSSSINGTTFISDLLITTLKSDAITKTNIQSNIVLGNVSVLSTDRALFESKISNNIIDGYASIVSQNTCMDLSQFDDNIVASLTIKLADPDSDLALNSSSVSGNKFYSNLVIDSSSESQTVELINSSLINSNVVLGSIEVGLSSSDSTLGNLANQSSFSNNKIAGSVDIGPATRSPNTNTYNNFTISNNVFGDSFTISGGIVGSNFAENSITNTTDMDAVSGSTIADNTFGDGSGGDTLSFNGDLTQNSVLSGNTVISGDTSFQGADNTVVAGNAFGGTVDFSSDVDTLNFASNNVTSTLSFANHTDTAVIGNTLSNVTFTDTGTALRLNYSDNISLNLTMDGSGTVSDSSISNNKISIVNITQTLEGTSFNNNKVTSTADFSALTKSLVNDNIFSNDVDFNSTVGEVVISSNLFDGPTDSAQFVGTTTDLVFEGNRTTASLIFSSAMNRVSVNDNIIGNEFNINNTVNDSVINNNKVNGTMLFSSTVTSSLFSSNQITSTVSTSGTHTNFNILGNVFESTVTLNGQYTNSMFSNNIAASTVTFSGSTSTGVLEGCEVSNNKVASTFTITYSGTSGGLTDGALRNSKFTGNWVGSNVIIQSTDSNSEHAMLNSVVQNNRISGSLEFSSVDTDLTIGVVVSSVIDGNYIGTNIDINHGSIDATQCINTIISDNSVGGDILIGNNLSGSTLDRYALLDSVVSGNKASDILMANTTRSGDAITYLDSVISNNSVDNQLLMRGACQNFNISGNTVNTFSIGRIQSSVISNNIVSGNSTVGNGATSASLMIGSKITGNRFTGTFTMNNADITTCEITGNEFVGAFNAATRAIQNSNISGNGFESTFSSNYWQNTTCVGNRFVGSLTVSSNTTGVSGIGLNRVTFQGNYCGSTANFNRPTTGSANNFFQCSFTGNVFVGNVEFGTSGSTDEYTRFVFVGNSGNGSVTINTGASTEMDSTMIVANSMNGSLTIAGGTYPSPPSSGTADPMIALNWFSSYSGITFSDDQAIGWGDNSSSVAIAASGVRGSNLS